MSNNDNENPIQRDCRTLLLWFTNSLKKRPEGRVCRQYAALYSHIAKVSNEEYHPSISNCIAQSITWYIQSASKRRRKTPEFLEDVQRKIFFLRLYNQSVIKYKGRFPYSEQLVRLLVQYIVLEFEVLFCSPNYDKSLEEEVENRITRNLELILFDSCKHGILTTKAAIDASSVAALKILTNVKTDHGNENKLYKNIINSLIVKFLKKIGMLTKLEEIVKDKNLTSLQNPILQSIRHNLIANDYAFHEQLSISDDECDDSRRSWDKPLGFESPVHEKLKLTNGHKDIGVRERIAKNGFPNKKAQKRENRFTSLQKPTSVNSTDGNNKSILTIEIIDDDDDDIGEVTYLQPVPQTFKDMNKTVRNPANNNQDAVKPTRYDNSSRQIKETPKSSQDQNINGAKFKTSKIKRQKNHCVHLEVEEISPKVTNTSSKVTQKNITSNGQLIREKHRNEKPKKIISDGPSGSRIEDVENELKSLLTGHAVEPLGIIDADQTILIVDDSQQEQFVDNVNSNKQLATTSKNSNAFVDDTVPEKIYQNTIDYQEFYIENDSDSDSAFDQNWPRENTLTETGIVQEQDSTSSVFDDFEITVVENKNQKHVEDKTQKVENNTCDSFLGESTEKHSKDKEIVDDSQQIVLQNNTDTKINGFADLGRIDREICHQNDEIDRYFSEDEGEQILTVEHETNEDHQKEDERGVINKSLFEENPVEILDEDNARKSPEIAGRSSDNVEQTEANEDHQKGDERSVINKFVFEENPVEILDEDVVDKARNSPEIAGCSSDNVEQTETNEGHQKEEERGVINKSLFEENPVEILDEDVEDKARKSLEIAGCISDNVEQTKINEDHQKEEERRVINKPLFEESPVEILDEDVEDKARRSPEIAGCSSNNVEQTENNEDHQKEEERGVINKSLFEEIPAEILDEDVEDKARKSPEIAGCSSDNVEQTEANEDHQKEEERGVINKSLFEENPAEILDEDVEDKARNSLKIAGCMSDNVEQTETNEGHQKEEERGVINKSLFEENPAEILDEDVEDKARKSLEIAGCISDNVEQTKINENHQKEEERRVINKPLFEESPVEILDEDVEDKARKSPEIAGCSSDNVEQTETTEDHPRRKQKSEESVIDKGVFEENPTGANEEIVDEVVKDNVRCEVYFENEDIRILEMNEDNDIGAAKYNGQTSDKIVNSSTACEETSSIALEIVEEVVVGTEKIITKSLIESNDKNNVVEDENESSNSKITIEEEKISDQAQGKRSSNNYESSKEKDSSLLKNDNNKLTSGNKHIEDIVSILSKKAHDKKHKNKSKNDKNNHVRDLKFEDVKVKKLEHKKRKSVSFDLRENVILAECKSIDQNQEITEKDTSSNEGNSAGSQEVIVQQLANKNEKVHGSAINEETANSKSLETECDYDSTENEVQSCESSYNVEITSNNQSKFEETIINETLFEEESVNRKLITEQNEEHDDLDTEISKELTQMQQEAQKTNNVTVLDNIIVDNETLVASENLEFICQDDEKHETAVNTTREEEMAQKSNQESNVVLYVLHQGVPEKDCSPNLATNEQPQQYKTTEIIPVVEKTTDQVEDNRFSVFLSPKTSAMVASIQYEQKNYYPQFSSKVTNSSTPGYKTKRHFDTASSPDYKIYDIRNSSSTESNFFKQSFDSSLDVLATLAAQRKNLEYGQSDPIVEYKENKSVEQVSKGNPRGRGRPLRRRGRKKKVTEEPSEYKRITRSCTKKNYEEKDEDYFFCDEGIFDGNSAIISETKPKRKRSKPVKLQYTPTNSKTWSKMRKKNIPPNNSKNNKTDAKSPKSNENKVEITSPSKPKPGRRKSSCFTEVSFGIENNKSTSEENLEVKRTFKNFFPFAPKNADIYESPKIETVKPNLFLNEKSNFLTAKDNKFQIDGSKCELDDFTNSGSLSVNKKPNKIFAQVAEMTAVTDDSNDSYNGGLSIVQYDSDSQPEGPKGIIASIYDEKTSEEELNLINTAETVEPIAQSICISIPETEKNTVDEDPLLKQIEEFQDNLEQMSYDVEQQKNDAVVDSTPDGPSECLIEEEVIVEENMVEESPFEGSSTEDVLNEEIVQTECNVTSSNLKEQSLVVEKVNVQIGNSFLIENILKPEVPKPNKQSVSITEEESAEPKDSGVVVAQADDEEAMDLSLKKGNIEFTDPVQEKENRQTYNDNVTVWPPKLRSKMFSKREEDVPVTAKEDVHSPIRTKAEMKLYDKFSLSPYVRLEKIDAVKEMVAIKENRARTLAENGKKHPIDIKNIIRGKFEAISNKLKYGNEKRKSNIRARSCSGEFKDLMVETENGNTFKMTLRTRSKSHDVSDSRNVESKFLNINNSLEAEDTKNKRNLNKEICYNNLKKENESSNKVEESNSNEMVIDDVGAVEEIKENVMESLESKENNNNLDSKPVDSCKDDNKEKFESIKVKEKPIERSRKRKHINKSKRHLKRAAKRFKAKKRLRLHHMNNLGSRLVKKRINKKYKRSRKFLLEAVNKKIINEKVVDRNNSKNLKIDSAETKEPVAEVETLQGIICSRENKDNSERVKQIGEKNSTITQDKEESNEKLVETSLDFVERVKDNEEEESKILIDNRTATSSLQDELLNVENKENEKEDIVHQTIEIDESIKSSEFYNQTQKEIPLTRNEFSLKIRNLFELFSQKKSLTLDELRILCASPQFGWKPYLSITKMFKASKFAKEDDTKLFLVDFPYSNIVRNSKKIRKFRKRSVESTVAYLNEKHEIDSLSPVKATCLDFTSFKDNLLLRIMQRNEQNELAKGEESERINNSQNSESAFEDSLNHLHESSTFNDDNDLSNHSEFDDGNTESSPVGENQDHSQFKESKNESSLFDQCQDSSNSSESECSNSESSSFEENEDQSEESKNETTSFDKCQNSSKFEKKNTETSPFDDYHDSSSHSKSGESNNESPSFGENHSQVNESKSESSPLDKFQDSLNHSKFDESKSESSPFEENQFKESINENYSQSEEKNSSESPPFKENQGHAADYSDIKEGNNESSSSDEYHDRSESEEETSDTSSFEENKNESSTFTEYQNSSDHSPNQERKNGSSFKEYPQSSGHPDNNNILTNKANEYKVEKLPEQTLEPPPKEVTVSETIDESISKNLAEEPLPEPIKNTSETDIPPAICDFLKLSNGNLTQSANKMNASVSEGFMEGYAATPVPECPSMPTLCGDEISMNLITEITTALTPHVVTQAVTCQKVSSGLCSSVDNLETQPSTSTAGIFDSTRDETCVTQQVEVYWTIQTSSETLDHNYSAGDPLLCGKSKSNNVPPCSPPKERVEPRESNRQLDNSPVATETIFPFPEEVCIDPVIPNQSNNSELEYTYIDNTLTEQPPVNQINNQYIVENLKQEQVEESSCDTPLSMEVFNGNEYNEYIETPIMSLDIMNKLMDGNQSPEDVTIFLENLSNNSVTSASSQEKEPSTDMIPTPPNSDDSIDLQRNIFPLVNLALTDIETYNFLSGVDASQFLPIIDSSNDSTKLPDNPMPNKTGLLSPSPTSSVTLASETAPVNNSPSNSDQPPVNSAQFISSSPNKKVIVERVKQYTGVNWQNATSIERPFSEFKKVENENRPDQNPITHNEISKTGIRRVTYSKVKAPGKKTTNNNSLISSAKADKKEEVLSGIPETPPPSLIDGSSPSTPSNDNVDNLKGESCKVNKVESPKIDLSQETSEETVVNNGAPSAPSLPKNNSSHLENTVNGKTCPDKLQNAAKESSEKHPTTELGSQEFDMADKFSVVKLAKRASKPKNLSQSITSYEDTIKSGSSRSRSKSKNPKQSKSNATTGDVTSTSKSRGKRTLPLQEDSSNDSYSSKKIRKTTADKKLQQNQLFSDVSDKKAVSSGESSKDSSPVYRLNQVDTENLKLTLKRLDDTSSAVPNKKRKLNVQDPQDRDIIFNMLLQEDDVNTFVKTKPKAPNSSSSPQTSCTNTTTNNQTKQEKVIKTTDSKPSPSSDRWDSSTPKSYTISDEKNRRDSDRSSRYRSSPSETPSEQDARNRQDSSLRKAHTSSKVKNTTNSRDGSESRSYHLRNSGESSVTKSHYSPNQQLRNGESDKKSRWDSDSSKGHSASSTIAYNPEERIKPESGVPKTYNSPNQQARNGESDKKSRWDSGGSKGHSASSNIAYSPKEKIKRESSVPKNYNSPNQQARNGDSEEKSRRDSGSSKGHSTSSTIAYSPKEKIKRESGVPKSYNSPNQQVRNGEYDKKCKWDSGSSKGSSTSSTIASSPEEKIKRESSVPKNNYYSPNQQVRNGESDEKSRRDSGISKGHTTPSATAYNMGIEERIKRESGIPKSHYNGSAAASNKRDSGSARSCPIDNTSSLDERIKRESASIPKSHPSVNNLHHLGLDERIRRELSVPKSYPTDASRSNSGSYDKVKAGDPNFVKHQLEGSKSSKGHFPSVPEDETRRHSNVPKSHSSTPYSIRTGYPQQHDNPSYRSHPTNKNLYFLTQIDIDKNRANRKSSSYNGNSGRYYSPYYYADKQKYPKINSIGSSSASSRSVSSSRSCEQEPRSNPGSSNGGPQSRFDSSYTKDDPKYCYLTNIRLGKPQKPQASSRDHSLWLPLSSLLPEPKVSFEPIQETTKNKQPKKS